jgi:hypothetical protein
LFGDNGILDKPATGIRRPDTSLLYSSVTGDPGDALYFPLNAVRWLTPPRDIAALVTESGIDKFGAELFHFGKRKRSISAEFYLLKPGRYVMTIAAKDGQEEKTLERHEFVVRGPRIRVSFELVPQKLCVLRVAPAG